MVERIDDIWARVKTYAESGLHGFGVYIEDVTHLLSLVDELRERKRPAGSAVSDIVPLGSLCPQCGFGVRVDEDACCVTCGATAVGEGADEAIRAHQERDELRECMRQAGLQCLMGRRNPHEVATYLRSVADGYEATDRENRRLKRELDELRERAEAERDAVCGRTDATVEELADECEDLAVRWTGNQCTSVTRLMNAARDDHEVFVDEPEGNVFINGARDERTALRALRAALCELEKGCRR